MSKREIILNSAALLFVEKGYKKLTMDEIAEYIGVTKKTLYNHFPGKFELMKESLEVKLNSILKEIKTIAEDKNEIFTTKLKKLIHFASKAFSDDFPLIKLSRENGIIHNIIFSAINEHVLFISREILKEGVEKGFLREDLKDETPPYILIGIIETFVNMQNRYGIKKTTGDMFIFIEKILLEGILSDKGRKEYRELGENL